MPISKEELLETINKYEISNFQQNNAKYRYFTIDESDYILPIKLIVQETMKAKNYTNEVISNLTSNTAENHLKEEFTSYKAIDTNKENTVLPLYQEIALKLLDYKDDRVALIDIMKDMKEKGLTTVSIDDQSENDEDITLRDIDPFTFYSNFNRRITSKNRANILKYLKDDWQLKSKIPTFDPHIPWMQNQSAWFFQWEKDRKKDDIDFLWKLFDEVLSSEVTPETFNRCLEIGQINNNLSFGLFWIDSDSYIALDSSTKEFIKNNLEWYKGEHLDKLKYKRYFKIIDDLKNKLPNRSFYEIVANSKVEGSQPTHIPDDESIYKFFPNNEEEFKRLAFENGKILVKISDKNNQLIKSLERDITTIWQNSVKLNLKTMHRIRNNYDKGYVIEAEIVYKEPQPINTPSNKILFGPPGTGKTYKLQELQELYKNRHITVTFHQSYGYEDFVEGLKADINENGDVYYKVENGILKDICDEAKINPNQNYAIFIDEINRGNISKIFGELITLIETSKRGMQITLPYSKELFSVPANLSIIGTMNTADRSIAVLDTALRRRFEFEEMMPHYRGLSSNIDGVNIQVLLETINQRIEYLYDRDHTIGHAYFIECNNFKDLQNTFKNKVLPLLQEYFYDDWEKINLVFNNNAFIDDTKKYNQDTLFSNCEDFDSFDDDKVIYKVDDKALKNLDEYKKIYE